MSLRDVGYREDYRSGYDNIVEDFFRPSLREAREYWRAVGYFSSSAFEAFGARLGEFIRRDGSMRLITSVELSEADLRAIEEGASRRRVCEDRVTQIIDEEFSDSAGDGTALLVRLLELDRLEIRIAVPTGRLLRKRAAARPRPRQQRGVPAGTDGALREVLRHGAEEGRGSPRHRLYAGRGRGLHPEQRRLRVAGRVRPGA